MVDILETVDRLTRTIQDRLNVRTAFGEPIQANGMTIVPVAKIGFGFGGGGGGGTGTVPAKGNGAMETMENAPSGSGGGGGGGGGGVVQPLGFIEVSDAGSRWIPLEPPRAEVALRALTMLAVVAPGGGRGGFLRRLLLIIAGQAIMAQMMRPSALGGPSMPEGFSFGRQPTVEARA